MHSRQGGWRHGGGPLRAALSRRASPGGQRGKRWYLQVKLNRLLTAGRMREGGTRGRHAAPPFKWRSYRTAMQSWPPRPTARVELCDSWLSFICRQVGLNCAAPRFISPTLPAHPTCTRPFAA